MSKRGVAYIVFGLVLVAVCCWVTIQVSRWYVFSTSLVAVYWILGAYYLDRRAEKGSA